MLAALGRDGGVYARFLNRRIDHPNAKRPEEIFLLLDDGIQLDQQVQEQRFYNRFDDSLFPLPTKAKP